MGTQANTYMDVVWESLDNSTMAAWFNSTGWEGWVSPADTQAGGPHEGEQANRFDESWIVSKWKRKSGKAIIYMRIRRADWDFLKALNPPTASFKIWDQVDPFAPLTFVDPDNPTQDELHVRDIWYQLKGRNAFRNAVRFYHPHDTGEDDGQGGTIKRGIRFGAFDEGGTDWKGNGES